MQIKENDNDMMTSRGFRAPTELVFGSYVPPPEMKVAQLEARVDFLTKQLVERERILQAEKDEFMSGLALTTTRLRNEAAEREARVLDLEAQLSLAKTPPPPPPECISPDRNEEVEALRARLEAAELAAARATRVSEDLESEIAKIRADAKSVEKDLEEAREARKVSEREVRKVTDTAKSLSLALKTASKKADESTKNAEGWKEMASSLTTNLKDAEKRAEEAECEALRLAQELKGTQNENRLMTLELVTRNNIDLQLTVWHEWFKTETRRLMQISRDYPPETFNRAAAAFVIKYRGKNDDEMPEAEKWVRQHVRERFELRQRQMNGSAPRGAPPSSTPMDSID